MSDYLIYNEKQLFSRISEGDEKAFEELFLAYVPQLEPVVRQIVTDTEAINDIIQEVFLYLWLGREKLPAVEDPRRWIFKIMYNRCYRWVRKQALIRRKMASPDFQNQPMVSRNTEEAVGFAETVRLLEQAVSQLTPQAQRIYLLHREKGNKIAHIAAELGISVQSVKNSLHRSGAVMRAFLKEHGVILPVILISFISFKFI